MQKTGKYNQLITGIIAGESIVVLNVLFVTLQLIIGLPFSRTYLWLQLYVNIGLITSLVLVPIELDFRKMQLRQVMIRDFYRTLAITFVTIGLLFLSHDSNIISRAFILCFFSSLYILLCALHYATRFGLEKIFDQESNQTKAIILGAGRMGQHFYEELHSNKYLAIHVLGFFDDDPLKKGEVLVLGTIDEVKEYVKTHEVHSIYCTLPVTAKAKIMEILEFCENNIITFHLIPTILEYNVPLVLEQSSSIPVLSVRQFPLSQAHNKLLKRMIDNFVSFIFLVTIFPFVYIIIGSAIKLTSKGPVFFKQERTGINGTPFYCYKFRSMRQNDEANTKQAVRNDDRITAVGRFMRRTNIDELPQFINVLKGEMSIVGPRPHMTRHTEMYAPLVDKYMVRHFIKPGVTGWAQVKGLRGETREVHQMKARIKSDIWYIENWSILLDLEIIARTVIVTFKGDKMAY